MTTVVVVSTLAGSGTRSASGDGGARVTGAEAGPSPETNTRSINTTPRNPYTPAITCGAATRTPMTMRTATDNRPVPAGFEIRYASMTANSRHARITALTPVSYTHLTLP